MKYQWIIQVGSSYFWAFENVTYATQPYTKKILNEGFTGVNLRWNLGSDLISSNDLRFTISDPEGALVATDFDGEDVYIRLLADAALKRTWKMKVKRTSAYYQKIKFECDDILQEYLNGDFPNTQNPRDIYPSDDPMPDDEYCVPVVLGTAYVPLRSVNTGTLRYYLLGVSGVTYDVLEVSSPHDWGNSSTWVKASYTMTPTVQGSYGAVQPMIHDVNGDGSEYAAGLWKSGDTFLDMPAKLTRSDTITTTGPADWISYVLQAFGVASGDIDITEYTGRTGLVFNGGWWEKESRESVLSSLLAQCDCYLSMEEDIVLKPFSKTSIETFTNVIKNSFRPSVVTKDISDGGSVTWQNSGKPQDILTGSATVPSYYGQASITAPDSTIFEARFITDSQDAQRAAILYFGKKLLQVNRIAFSVAGPSITNLATLVPGQVVTVNNVNYGGSKAYVITGMTFGKDLNVRFDCAELSTLQDWADVSSSAVPIVADSTAALVVPTIANAPMIGIKINTVSFDTSTDTYAYIHGFDGNGDAADIKGKITYNGALLYIPQTENSTTWTIDTSQEQEGYIVLDTALAEKFTVSATGHSVVFAKLDTDVWYYDNGAGWTEWTPTSTDTVIGTMSVGATSINSANVWAYGQDLGSIIEAGSGDDTETVVNDDMLEIQGWQFPSTFASVDANTVSWTAATLTFSGGQSFSIAGNNTGNMAATTYIYFSKSVSTTQLQTTTTATNAVGANKVLIARASVGTVEASFFVFGGFGGNMISNVNIEVGTITATEIASNAVTAVKILNGAVETLKIANTAITEAKVGTGAITATKIGTYAVTSDKIIANAVTTAKINADAVTANEIVAGAIGTTELAADSVVAAKIAAGEIGTTELSANCVTSAKILAGTITASEIAANTITANEIVANTITASEINTGAITATEIATGTITANEIAANTLTSTEINTSVITIGSFLNAGNLAEADSVSYTEVTGTKPPTDADNTVANETFSSSDAGNLAVLDTVSDTQITSIAGGKVTTGRIASTDAEVVFDLDNSIFYFGGVGSDVYIDPYSETVGSYTFTGITMVSGESSLKIADYSTYGYIKLSNSEGHLTMNDALNTVTLHGNSTCTVSSGSDVVLDADDDVLVTAADVFNVTTGGLIKLDATGTFLAEGSSATMQISGATNKVVCDSGGVGITAGGTGDDITLTSADDITFDAVDNINIDCGGSLDKISFKSAGSEMVWIKSSGLFPTDSFKYLGWTDLKWKEVYGSAFYDDGVLLADTLDDLHELSSFKPLKKMIEDPVTGHKTPGDSYIHEKSGAEYMDLSTLPHWLTNYDEVVQKLKEDWCDFISDDEIDDMIADYDEAGWLLARNTGAFNDLTNGAVRQLHTKTTETFELMVAQITALEARISELEGV